MPEINEFGQQVNDRVPGWQGAGLLRRTALNGRFCRLEPLDTERHAADLFAAYALGDDSDWTWLASNCPQSVESTANWITGKVMDDGLVPYAVIDLRAERAVGLVSYMAIERAMGTVAKWFCSRLSSAGVEVRFDESRLPPRRRPAGVYLGGASSSEDGAQRTHPR